LLVHGALNPVALDPAEAQERAMPNLTSAGRLLESLHSESPEICDAVASAAGLSADRVAGAMRGGERLSLSEQLRLSEATALLAPAFTADALRLRGHVLSARSMHASEVGESQRDPAVDPWERAAAAVPFTS
jgi:hypothetical protein